MKIIFSKWEVFWENYPLELPRMKISVITDISVLRFYGYIGYIGDIFGYIGGYFGKKYWCLKLLKTHENVKKTS